MKNLWAFALDFYQHPPIKEACLTLQDKAGVDVCVLLSVVWLGANGKCLNQVELARLESAAALWQQKATLPLRELRERVGRMMSAEALQVTNNINHDAVRSMYQQLKSAELEAEQITLAQLQALIGNLHIDMTLRSESSLAVTHNVHGYLSKGELALDDKQDLDAITRLFLQYLD